MNAVIYARYSTDGQREESIEGQLRICHAYAKRYGITVVAEYIDKALSASKNVQNREQFLDMVHDAARGKFEAVIVYKLNRFARNRYDSAVYKRKLRSNGVRVLSATENITDDPSGALLEGVLESVDEFFSRNLAQDVRRGMYENAKQAMVTGGTIPFGYRSVDKKLQIDPVAASAVKQIFAWYADGWSCRRIADALNAKGLVTAKGKPFTSHSFFGMLHNRKYVGVYHYNGEIALQDAVPPIVDKLTFERVQARMQRLASAPAHNKATTHYLLTGKLVCASCGAQMFGESCLKKDKHYYYYTCASHKRGRGCAMKPVPKDEIEDYVAQRAASIFTPDTIADIAAMAMEEYNRCKDKSEELDALKKRKSDVDRAMQNLIKAIENGVDSTLFTDRINDLQRQSDAILGDIAELERGVPDFDEVSIVAFLQGFAQQGDASPEYRANLMDMLVNHVRISEDNQEHQYNVVFNLTSPGAHGSDMEGLVHH